MKLRPYQRQAIQAAFKEWKRGHRSTLFVCPTGGGKSLTFSRVAERFRPQGRTLILADREWLVGQAARNVNTHTRLVAGIEMGDARVDRANLPDVVVASVQSLHRRLGDFAPDAFGLIVVDEADLALAPTYRKIIDHFPRAKVLGVTATPDRADGQALGDLFETVCHRVEIADLIRAGYLAPIRQRVVKVLDLTLAKVADGDFTDASLERILTQERHLHEVVKPTLELRGNRPTLVFATSVAHAAKLAEVFNRYQPGCARHVHGGMDRDERRDVIDPFLRGEFPILVNCALLLRGVDLPPVACIAMARPTQSRALYAQALGRGTRLHPGKTDCLVLDFAETADKHSLVTALDILGGKRKPETVERARELLDEKPDRDVLDALDEAEREIEADPELRARVLAIVKFRTAAAREEIDWDAQPLGKMFDSVLAKRLGVATQSVQSARMERGIPSFKSVQVKWDVDWDAQPFAQCSDRAIAKRLSVPISVVRTERERRGIARSKWSRRVADWSCVGLGTKEDRVLAEELGVSAALVAARRKQMNIPPFGHTQPKEIDWNEADLGSVPDAVIARRLGVSKGAVRRARTLRGIARAEMQVIDWDAQPLGRVSDETIAAALDTSVAAVARQRRARGLPAGARPPIDWDSVPLGAEPDTVVASKLGVGQTTVCAARNRCGIPPFKKPRKPRRPKK